MNKHFEMVIRNYLLVITDIGNGRFNVHLFDLSVNPVMDLYLGKPDKPLNEKLENAFHICLENMCYNDRSEVRHIVNKYFETCVFRAVFPGEFVVKVNYSHLTHKYWYSCISRLNELRTIDLASFQTHHYETEADCAFTLRIIHATCVEQFPESTQTLEMFPKDSFIRKGL